MTKLKNPIQVVDTLTMPIDLRHKLLHDYFMKHNHVDNVYNGIYCRCYPIGGNDDPKEIIALMLEVNNWLMENGYYIDWSNEYFHVIMYFNW